MPAPAKKKITDELLLQVVIENPGLMESQIAAKFGHPAGNAWGKLNLLLHAGKIRIEGKRGKGLHPKYYPVDKPAEKSDQEKEAEGHIVAPGIALLRGDRVTQEQLAIGDKTRREEAEKKASEQKPALPAAAEPSKGPSVPQHVIESFAGLRTGHDKDSDHKADILKILSETPGIGVQKISDLIRVDARRTRNLLIGLEEEHEIEVVKGKGRYGPRTGYYLKAAVPKEAC